LLDALAALPEARADEAKTANGLAPGGRFPAPPTTTPPADVAVPDATIGDDVGLLTKVLAEVRRIRPVVGERAPPSIMEASAAAAGVLDL
jgi:hypothetical protein